MASLMYGVISVLGAAGSIFSFPSVVEQIRTFVAKLTLWQTLGLVWTQI